MYEYACEVKRVVDGDTIDVVLDLGFDILFKSRVRLYGIDTPESRTRDLDENEAMIENFLAVAYFGQSKDDVEAEHLINREKLIEQGLFNPEEIK